MSTEDNKAIARRWSEELWNQADLAVADDIVAPADITVQTYLWQGEQDVTVPPTMGAYLAHTIPHCQSGFIPNEGQLMYLNHWQQILSILGGVTQGSSL